MATDSEETIDIVAVYKCISANATNVIGNGDVNVNYVDVTASCYGQ